VGAIIGGALAWGGSAPAQAQMPEIVVNITHVRALDRADWPVAGQADFYAQVTIAGEAVKTPRVRQQDEIRPNWRVSKRVPPGTYTVKIEMLDRDVFKPDDRIDINRVSNRREIEFQVDTRPRPCRIDGGGSFKFRCGKNIDRSGNERKRAQIEFTVDVNR
jgi:hypothetical protein